MEGTVQDRSRIDGTLVITTNPAKFEIRNIQNQEMELHPVDQVEECLLDDGRVVYRCNSKNGPCDWWNVNPISVRSHLRKHSDRAQHKRAEAALEEARLRAEEAERELAERIRRKSEGSKQGALTRKARLAEASNNGRARTPRGVAVPTVSQVREIATTVEKLIADVGKMADAAVEVRTALKTTLHKLAHLEPMALDPEVVAKAEAYDDLQRLLNRPPVK